MPCVGIAHCTLYITQCAQVSVQSSLFTIQCAVYRRVCIVCIILCNVQCGLQAVLCPVPFMCRTLYTVCCAVYCTIWTVQFMLCILLDTMDCAVCTVQWCTVHYGLCNVYSAVVYPTLWIMQCVQCVLTPGTQEQEKRRVWIGAQAVLNGATHCTALLSTLLQNIAQHCTTVHNTAHTQHKTAQYRIRLKTEHCNTRKLYSCMLTGRALTPSIFLASSI